MQRDDVTDLGAMIPPLAKPLRFGFNGWAFAAQLLLSAVGIGGTLRAARSIAFFYPWGMAGMLAIFLLYLSVPITILTALIGIRQKTGAGRPTDQPRKILTIDLLELTFSLLLIAALPVLIILPALAK